MDEIKLEELWERHNVHEKLYKRYRDEIYNNFYPHLLDLEVVEDGMNDSKYLRDYLGSVMSIMPSGKFYMPWTTNQTIRDVWKDRAFIEALEDVLEGYGMWLESGEGDPTDLFVCTQITEEEEEDEGDSE